MVGRNNIFRGAAAAVSEDLVSSQSDARSRQWLYWNFKKIAESVAGRPYLAARQLLLRKGIKKVGQSVINFLCPKSVFMEQVSLCLCGMVRCSRISLDVGKNCDNGMSVSPRHRPVRIPTPPSVRSNVTS